MSPKERHKLVVASPGVFIQGFYLTELLFAVAIGDPGPVANMIRRTSPGKLFEKDDVTDALGQIFHNISPLQLMLFLFDWDMLNQIKPLISYVAEFMRELDPTHRASSRRSEGPRCFVS